MRFNPYSLRFKLMLASTLVEVLMLSLLLVNAMRLINQAMLVSTEAALKQTVPMLNVATAPYLVQGDYATLQDNLNEMIGNVDQGVQYVVVRDNAGRIAAKAGVTDVASLPAPSASLADALSGSVLHVERPLSLAGQTVGTLRFGLSTSIIALAKTSVLRQSSLIVATEILLTFVLLSLLGYWLTRNLGKFVELSRAVADGHYDLRASESGRDEVANLARNFNRMSGAVERTVGELRASEQRFRSLADLSSDWYWERDDEGRLVAISQGFLDIVGMELEQLLGTRRGDASDIAYPESAHWHACQACIAGHLPFYDMEWQFSAAGGNVRNGVISGEPMFDMAGIFRGYRGVGRDLTAVRSVETAQKSALRLRHLVEHLPAGAIYIEGDQMLLNAAAEQITGYARAEIVNPGAWFRKIFASDAARAVQQYEADKAAGFPTPRELELMRKDGSSCTIEFTAYADETSEVWLLHDISGRKRIEAEFQQTLLEKQALFDNANIGIVFAKNRFVQHCNRGLEELLGYEPDELIGQSSRVFFASDESYESSGRAGYTAIAQGKNWLNELEIVRKNNEKIWCLYSGKAVDPADPSKGVVSVVYDISERKQAEAALQQALLEQQAIFENANVGIYLVKDRVYQRCNRQFEQMLGYQPGELTGASTRILYSSDEAYEAFGRIAYAALARGERWVGEFEFRRKDGSMFWANYHGSAIDARDLSKGSIWVVSDISERKRTEAALELALLEQQAIFDNANIGISIARERVYQRCNRGFEMMLGYQAGELVGKSTRISFSSDASFEAFGQIAYPVIYEGRNWIGEWEMVRKDGSRCWCYASGSAVDAQDQAKGTIWVAQDITERKLAEAALVQAKAELELSLAEVGQTHREVMLLSELSSFLQACQSASEAHAAIGAYAPRLFPGTAGVLYIMDEEQQALFGSASWGDTGADADSFLPDECWALRRGRPYRQDHPRGAMCCPHLHADEGVHFPYACLPLLAQGACSGLLFIRHPGHAEACQIETRYRLAVALAEQAGLALANIRLRATLRANWAGGRLRITYPRPESEADARAHYPVALLTLALQKAGVDFQLQASRTAMPQERALRELEAGGELSVLWTMTSVERESRALPIRICITKGLIGWRIPLLRADRREQFRTVRSIDDLARFNAGQGADWPDAPILRANGLPVQGVSDYEALFDLLRQGQIDYFPRGVHEIAAEAAAHPGVAIDAHIALHYPQAFYFFVNRQNVALAQVIERGLESALADGSFDSLFERYHQEQIRAARLERRHIFHLSNPLLPPQTPLSRAALWYVPKSAAPVGVEPEGVEYTHE